MSGDLKLENILLVGLVVIILFYLLKPSMCGNQKIEEGFSDWVDVLKQVGCNICHQCPGC